MATLYVQQDGRDFYHYSDKACTQLIRTVSAPFRVMDFDMWWAKRARDWHDRNGYFKGADEVVYCGPMGYRDIQRHRTGG